GTECRRRQTEPLGPNQCRPLSADLWSRSRSRPVLSDLCSGYDPDRTSPLSAALREVKLMSANRETENQVPKFKSLEEEAEFWDTHSPLDYPDYWKDVEPEKSQRPLSHILGVRLDAKVIGELSNIAQRKGI